MLRKRHQRAGSRLGIEALESRAMLSGTPINVDTFADISNPDDGLTSLREAIVAARDNIGDDRIKLPKGHYPLDPDLGQLEINDSSGNLTIQSGGATIDAGGNNHRVLHVSGSDTKVELKGLTITGGNAKDASNEGFGGGIFNDGSTVTVKNSRITGNLSNEGGGILNGGNGTFVLKNSIVRNNRAEADVFLRGNGGGISNINATLIVINSQVMDNSARRDALNGAFGGGIISVGTTNFPGSSSGHAVTLLNSEVSGNTANGGGGGIMMFSRAAAGTLTVTNSRITHNTAVEDAVGGPGLEIGGGIITDGILGGSHEMMLINSRVTGNEAGHDGGGISIGGLDSVTLKNSRVTENEAGNDGGGVWNGGTLTLVHSRINENESENSGGGLFNAIGATFDPDRQSKVEGNEPDDIFTA